MAERLVGVMTDHEFRRIVNYIKIHYGIELEHKRTLINGRLSNYLVRNGYSSYDEYMNEVERDITGKASKELVDILTTNHTYFMREVEHFEFYRRVVLRELSMRSRNKSLSIWCGASSTGEEPYTLAMYTRDYFGLKADEWDTRILATDISTKVLEHAQKGIYLKEAIKPLPEGWKRHYFKSINDEECQVSNELRNQVIFRQHNLMDEINFKTKMQVIFLRNVMIYFNDDTKRKLINRIYDCMEPGGYLFIGASESIDKTESRFKFVRPSIFRK